MNQYVPDWNLDDDSTSFRGLAATNQKKPIAPDNELIELLWQDGHVVMHSQTHRRSPATVGEFKQVQKDEPALKYGAPLGNSSNLVQDETSSWFPYPLDDSLEKEFCSEFFCEMPNVDAIGTNKMGKDVTAEGDRSINFGSDDGINVLSGSDAKQSSICFQKNTMPPPKSHVIATSKEAPGLENSNALINFSHFSRPVKADLGSLKGQLRKEPGKGIQVGAGESSMMTIGSSICGSNQIQTQADPSNTLSSDDAAGVAARGPKEDAQMTSLSERARTSTYETTVTSSSGGSGCSFGIARQQNASNQSHKRKGRHAEESECQSEEAEYESVEANKPVQRLAASTRRSRAAEVHNLSERRRRDRINEKMKALQELIPHCNKTDKASMLDEAIEYLKSLQLQVQIMWMGSGMAPMMFPGVQQYMSRMGMGMGHASMPSMHGPVQLPRVPFVNQSIPSASTAHQTPLCPSPALNAVNFPNQMQNVHLPESYARYLGLHHMQPPSQAMNFYTYGSHMMQQNQTTVAPTSSAIPTTGEVPSENNQINKSG